MIVAEAARRALEEALAALFPAPCHLCARPLPWRQQGGVCSACWQGIPWAPGILRRSSPPRVVLWAAPYEDPLRHLIHGLKFGGIESLGRPLGAAMAAALGPLLDRVGRPDVVVPVPLHWFRRARRGYNQALLLAHGLSAAAALPIDPRLLRRRRPGRRQTGRSRLDRLRSLESAFVGDRDASGLSVLVVDDVMTTGATLEACARALGRAGARRVTGAVLARTIGISG